MADDISKAGVGQTRRLGFDARPEAPLPPAIGLPKGKRDGITMSGESLMQIKSSRMPIV